MSIRGLQARAILAIAWAFSVGAPAIAAPPPPAAPTRPVLDGFVAIEPGIFQMGSPKNEAGRLDNETQHGVTISRPFWLQATEVTQGQWEQLMGSNPASFNKCGPQCPVEMVSWEDAVAYLNKLSEKEGLEACYEGTRLKAPDCQGYRLPTEAEWEYAARAATKAERDKSPDAFAWYQSNSVSRTHAVAQKRSNAWGLYDMLGNVYEWVQDWDGAYPTAAVTDPTGPPTGVNRLYRGGGWDSDAAYVRPASRLGYTPSFRHRGIGFRAARTLPPTTPPAPASNP
jgi:formylglycine-generating enzyme required for sulfatase activity